MMPDVISSDKKKFYMKKALAQACKSLNIDEVPVGAVVVSKEGQILSFGYNQVEKAKTQIAHAEVLAISKAAKKIKDWRLAGASIYVTLEPCSMCWGLIFLSRIENVFYGAKSPLFGSNIDLTNLPHIYKKHIKVIEGGVCQLEAAELLKDFFKKKRS